MSDAVCSASTQLSIHSLPHILDSALCNSGDALASSMLPGSKLLWFVRHGQSTGNVAKEAAREADRDTGRRDNELLYTRSFSYVDTPLTEIGCAQASSAQSLVCAWTAKPELIVCSPMTRAIQTAALMFGSLLQAGFARLHIRPELREFWSDNNENRGRPLAELRQCVRLHELPQWSFIDAALSEDATAEWSEQWDNDSDGAWQAHCDDARRLISFKVWLNSRRETRVAVVSHWGTINNMMNREPWADEYRKEEVPETWNRQSWPEGGLAKRFNMPNSGWIAVVASPVGARESQGDVDSQ